jgi:hypothetical protein
MPKKIYPAEAQWRRALEINNLYRAQKAHHSNKHPGKFHFICSLRLRASAGEQ